MFKIKKEKLKMLINQKDEQIADLKLRNEEFSNLNENELYLLSVEKNKIYKEKIKQSAKYIEDQKSLLRDKENTIEDLLLKLENLA